MIGNIVTVKVDRPMGSYHPEHKDMYYPINYGYIEGINQGANLFSGTIFRIGNQHVKFQLVEKE